MTERELVYIGAILGNQARDDVFMNELEVNHSPSLFPEIDVIDERPKAGRCSKREKDLRKNIVRKLLIAGVSNQLIFDYCKLKFSVSSAQIYRYLDEISEEMEEAAEKDTQYMIGLQLQRLEQALLDCQVTFDMGNRLKALKEINELFNLKKNIHEIGEGSDIDFNVTIVKAEDQLQEVQKTQAN